MEGNKLVIAGLDKAGKSTIMQRVFYGADIDELDNHSPTRGVQREQIKLTEEQIQYVFWELGGQEQYKQDHTTKPQLFAQTKLLIFVIDIQDDSRYEAAINYLQELIMLLRESTFESHVTVILHKFDPNEIAKLRTKQFVIFKLLKELQSNFPSVDFSQHSTSIYDDTLYYTFQNIFQRLGLDIGAYKTSTEAKVTLAPKSKDEPETRAEALFTQELNNRFRSILESAKTGITHLASEFGEFDHIQKLHKIMVTYLGQFHEISGIEKKREAVDAVIIAYIEYMADLTLEYLESGYIMEKDAQYILLFVGQLNLIKIRVVHYMQNTSIEKISDPLKFMENLKQLTNDLMDSSYIMGNLTLDQLEQMKLLINGVTNSHFSLFREDSQNVYTFTRIQDLKSAFAQNKFVPTKMIIKIELAELLKDAYVGKIEELIAQNQASNVAVSDIMDTFVMRLDYLIIEFYQIVVEENLRDYDMERVLSTKFQSITNQILNIAELANILGEGEKLKIRNFIETVR